MTPFEIVSIVLLSFELLFIIIAAVVAICEYSKNNKFKRTELINEAIKSFYDLDNYKIFCDIDLDRKKGWYNEKIYNSEDTVFMAAVDKLLLIFNNICYLRNINVLSDREIGLVEYKLERILTTYDIHNYLWNLYHFSKKCQTMCSFQYLIEYGFEHNYIEKETFTSIKEGSKYYDIVLAIL